MSHWNIWLSTFRYRRVVVVDDGSFCIIDFRHITKHQDVAPMPSSTFFYATKKWSSHKCQSLLKSHNVSFLYYKDIAYDLDHKCIHCKECSFVYFSDKSEQMVAKKEVTEVWNAFGQAARGRGGTGWFGKKRECVLQGFLGITLFGNHEKKSEKKKKKLKEQIRFAYIHKWEVFLEVFKQCGW